PPAAGAPPQRDEQFRPLRSGRRAHETPLVLRGGPPHLPRRGGCPSGGRQPVAGGPRRGGARRTTPRVSSSRSDNTTSRGRIPADRRPLGGGLARWRPPRRAPDDPGLSGANRSRPVVGGSAGRPGPVRSGSFLRLPAADVGLLDQ